MFARHLYRAIAPALNAIADEVGRPEFGSRAACHLVVGTAAAESGFAALYQHPTGPALGLWQVEPGTWRDIEANYLAGRPAWKAAIGRYIAPEPRDSASQLVTSLCLGALACRLVYWRQPLKLPAADDIAGQARIWKAVYNTAAGQGTPAHYEAAWRRLVLPHL